MTAGTQERSDLEVIAPAEGGVTVAGVACTVRRVRLRELMLLARVLTAGVGSNLREVDLSGGDDELQGQVLGLLLMAIPEAIDETVALLQALVEPTPEATEAERKRVRAELANPEAEVAFDVIGVLAAQERDTWPLLWGKARAVFGQLVALYQTGKKDS